MTGLTLKEVFQNAERNLSSNVSFQQEIGRIQLDIYLKVKELGATDEDNWDDWLDKINNQNLNNADIQME